MKSNLLPPPALLLRARGGAPPAVAAKSPVKVFILAGQSNMEGQGVADLEGKDYYSGSWSTSFPTSRR
jgi:hypothetical protein